MYEALCRSYPEPRAAELSELLRREFGMAVERRPDEAHEDWLFWCLYHLECRSFDVLRLTARLLREHPELASTLRRMVQAAPPGIRLRFLVSRYWGRLAIGAALLLTLILAAAWHLYLTNISCPQGSRLIQAGTYPGDRREDGRGLRKSRVAAFCMDQEEVTVQRFNACVRAGACKAPSRTVFFQEGNESLAKWSQLCVQVDDPSKAYHPINCVSFEEAEAFCRWAGGDVPTAAQWAFAAAGPGGRRFPWGNELPDPSRLNYCDENCKYAGVSAGLGPLRHLPGGDGWAGTAPVNSYGFGHTPDGLRDMAGNVAEWVRRENEVSPGVAEVRGGGWSDPAYPENEWLEFETGHSTEIDKRRKTVALGFRCVYAPARTRRRD